MPQSTAVSRTRRPVRRCSSWRGARQEKAVTSKKDDASDWIRIGRVYYDAKEWNKAFAAFERALQLKLKDAPEVGAFYNLRGNRAKAEELFDRSFQQESDEVWNTINMTGSYFGVEPLR